GSGDVITCSHTTANLTASSSTGGVTYSWTGPGGFTSTAQNPTTTTSGVYTVVARNPVNGCTSSDTANINLNNTNPGVGISPTSGTITCSTTSILLTAS